MSEADRTLFARLYREEWAAIYRRTGDILYVRHLREDVTALAFIRLWQRMETGTVRNPEGFLRKVAADLARNALRDLGRRRAAESPVGLIPELAAIEEEFYARGRPLPDGLWTFPTEFDLAVRDLDVDGRHAFILTDLRGLRQEEAAPILGVDHSTVSRRAAQARAHIRKELF